MSDSFFCTAKYAMRRVPSSPAQKKLKQKVPRKQRAYVATTDLDWIQRAARLKGKALHCALALAYRSGLKKSKTVRLSNRLLADFGVKRTTGYNALKELEKAGLISVTRCKSKGPDVTIIIPDQRID